MSLTDPEVPEPQHPRSHPRPRRTELVLSIAALVVSFSSIALAVYHGRILKRLVVANSYPYVEGGKSNASPSGEPRLSVDLMNRGVGPAHERSLRLAVGGRYVRTLDELYAEVFGDAGADEARRQLRSYANVVETRFISPGADQPVFQIPRTDENGALWDKLDQAMRSMAIEYCYCSVFEECWEVRGEARERVKQCERDPAREFKP